MKTVSQATIDHVVILVRAFESSLAYYEALLRAIGFDKFAEHSWRNAQGFIIQIQEARPESVRYERYAPGVNHLGMRVPAAEDVTRLQAAMRDLGLEAPEIQNLDGVTALFMKDPDGFRIEISYFPDELDAAKV